MHHYIYKITNIINGRYYIGCHSTHDINDGYMGSGKLIKRAIRKYGEANFTKIIIQHFNTAEEMFSEESKFIDLTDPLSYNLSPGGEGGFGYINRNGLNTFLRNPEQARSNRRKANITLENKYGPKWKEISAQNARSKLQHILSEDPSYIKRSRQNYVRVGRPHTDESRRKIGMANSVHQQGSNNNNFGKRWITNGTSNKLIFIDGVLPCGWKYGRFIE